MKKANRIFFVILVLLLFVTVQEYNKASTLNKYYRFSVEDTTLSYNIKKVLIDLSKEYDIQLFSPYFDKDSNLIIYGNEKFTEDNNDVITNAKYKNFNKIDEYKEMDNDIYFIPKSQSKVTEMKKDLNNMGISTIVIANANYYSSVLLLIVSFILFIIIIFFNFFDLNKRRVEICLKKIYGKKASRGEIRTYVILLAIILILYEVQTSYFIYTVSMAQMLGIYLVLSIFLFKLENMEAKFYEKQNILPYIKGENIDSVFLKYEYLILVVIKGLIVIASICLAITLSIIINLRYNMGQYKKLENYYTNYEYLEKKDVSQDEFLNLNVEETSKLDYESDRSFVTYMENRYDAIYAYNPNGKQVEESGELTNQFIISNEKYLEVNGNDDLVHKEEKLDYILVPEEFKGKLEDLKKKYENSPQFKDVKYQLYFYTKINESINIDGDKPFTYKRPIIYVNKNYYNDEFYVYANQVLKFTGGQNAIEQYYEDNKISYSESDIGVYSQYNMYTTAIHTSYIVALLSMGMTVIILILYFYVVRMKISSYFLDNSKELTIKKLNGCNNLYTRIYINYLLLDTYCLIVSSVVMYILFMLGISLIVCIIIIVMECLALYLSDILIIKKNIKDMECLNILNTIKGA